MKQIAIEVADEQKADLLVELLSSLDFVQALEVHESNGQVKRTEETYPRPYISPQHEQMRKEERAFDSMHADLIANHLGEFVAVFQQNVVDHHQDELALLGRINRFYPDDVVLIRPVLEHPEPTLVFRSPRLICEG